MFTRFYYTLNELNDASVAFNQQTFKTLFTLWNVSYVATEDDKIKELYHHLQESYGDEFIVYIDIPHPYYEDVDKPSVNDLLTDTSLAYYKKCIQSDLRKIKGWIDDTQFRYYKLIGLYDDTNGYGTKLMDDIKSTTQFNDCPQTTQTGLDGDAYATTYTTAKTAGGTNMQRLTEIRGYWTSLYGEWSAEFARKFIMY